MNNKLEITTAKKLSNAKLVFYEKNYVIEEEDSERIGPVGVNIIRQIMSLEGVLSVFLWTDRVIVYHHRSANKKGELTKRVFSIISNLIITD